MNLRRLVFVALMGAGLSACTTETLVESIRREITESKLNNYAMEGYPRTFPKIAERLREEAEAGDPVAQSRLGELYFFGFGVPRDAAKEAKWFHKAAVGGHGPSQATLAWIYLKGDILAQDYRRALEWLRRSGANGWEKGGRQYRCLLPKAGGHRKTSPSAGLEGRGSALPDMVDSYFTTGIMWWSFGCETKYTRWGLESFVEAANAGHPKAQYMVGVAYLSGRGTAPGRARAGRWFLRAARQGHGAAKREYCALHRAGATAPEIVLPGGGGCRGVPPP